MNKNSQTYGQNFLHSLYIVSVGVILGAVLALLLFATAERASATRAIPGHNYSDVCKNVKGKQTILAVHMGMWTQTGKGHCIPGPGNRNK